MTNLVFLTQAVCFDKFAGIQALDLARSTEAVAGVQPMDEQFDHRYIDIAKRHSII